MRVLLWPFMILSACGFIASAAVHLAATFGVAIPRSTGVWALHSGVSVVGPPMAFVVWRFQMGIRLKDFMGSIKATCPPWMSKALFFIFIYTSGSFFVFFAGKGVWPLPFDKGSWELRGFSGHWMFFYAVIFVALYSAYHQYSAISQSSPQRERKCPSGHAVSSKDQFCSHCGEELREDSGAS